MFSIYLWASSDQIILEIQYHPNHIFVTYFVLNVFEAKNNNFRSKSQNCSYYQLNIYLFKKHINVNNFTWTLFCMFDEYWQFFNFQVSHCIDEYKIYINMKIRTDTKKILYFHSKIQHVIFVMVHALNYIQVNQNIRPIFPIKINHHCKRVYFLWNIFTVFFELKRF